MLSSSDLSDPFPRHGRSSLLRKPHPRSDTLSLILLADRLERSDLPNGRRLVQLGGYQEGERDAGGDDEDGGADSVGGGGLEFLALESGGVCVGYKHEECESYHRTDARAGGDHPGCDTLLAIRYA